MTGSSITTPDSIAPRFDWYAASINASVDSLREVLGRELGGTVHLEEGAKHGFHYREVVKDLEGRTVATILHGGNGDIPHAFASSDSAHRFAEIVRRHWADRHRVSRVDSAIDFDDGPGTWATLLELCEGIARGDRVDGDNRKRISKIRTGQMGDWFHGEHGRTFYLGSHKSAVLVRLYEKGIQLREDAAKRGLRRDDISDNLVRLEVQVRPDGASKTHAAASSPLEIFGYAEWSRELLRRLNGVDVQRVNIKERRDSDHERAMQWMVQQYGQHLLIEALALGSWEALGADLRRRLETSQSSSDNAWDGDAGTPF